MDRLFSMRIFVQVVENASFAAAARALDISPAMATRAVASLENRLRSRLLQRSTRSVTPTPIGLDYAQRCQVILDAVAQADEVAVKDHIRPSGVLRVALPSTLALTILPRVFSDFTYHFPEVSLDISIVDRHIDLVEDGYDMAIALDTMLTSESIVSRCVPFGRFIACCTPTYLGSRPVPTQWHDLIDHRVLCLRRFTEKVRALPSNRLDTSTSSAMLRMLALENCGIALLPDFMVRDDLAQGRLIQVLSEAPLPEMCLWLAYPTRQYISAKVSRFMEAALSALET
uniref:LysR family transcriptional regulator n=1 Tax=Cupriavidus necator TaxID=106590 RepID=UPI003F4924CA